MINIHYRNEFEQHIIAQDDDEDHSESGWVVVARDGVAAMANYGHCSCYGTWEAINGGGISDYFDDKQECPDPKWDWSGSVVDVIDMAKRRADPHLPGRVANPKDIDYDHLCAVYEKVLEWWAGQAKQK
jgi:hypothetical protein